MDGTSGDVIIEAVYENHPVKGELTIVKKGEVLDGFKDDFTYQTENLEGAEFEIYAARTSILQISRKMIMETVFWNMLLEYW